MGSGSSSIRNQLPDVKETVRVLDEENRDEFELLSDSESDDDEIIDADDPKSLNREILMIGPNVTVLQKIKEINHTSEILVDIKVDDFFMREYMPNKSKIEVRIKDNGLYWDVPNMEQYLYFKWYSDNVNNEYDCTMKKDGAEVSMSTTNVHVWNMRQKVAIDMTIFVNLHYKNRETDHKLNTYKVTPSANIKIKSKEFNELYYEKFHIKRYSYTITINVNYLQIPGSTK
ncbi:SMAD domain-like [Cinara cedri]|uniref:SMAD domain-like n=1 Tax=Cinara cedri TaxID=506608 RepID=A0A5E4N4R6_9HEMI|nr:SMAD domain-like [Cinara cedri]